MENSYKNETYKCNLCLKDLSLDRRLNKHLGTHTREKPCNLCLKDRHLKKHARTHIREKPCNLCLKNFSPDRRLIKHLGTHTGENMLT